MTRGDAHPCPEIVEDDQRAGGKEEDPEKLIAGLGTQHGVRRDPGGIVIGKAGEQPGAQDGKESEERATAAHGVESSETESAAVAAQVCVRPLLQSRRPLLREPRLRGGAVGAQRGERAHPGALGGLLMRESRASGRGRGGR